MSSRGRVRCATDELLDHEMKRVGRYRERDYQRAAQKQNEAFRKYDYYQQIARYFERECRVARHYDSWNYRNPDPKGVLEKAKKAERLQARRNKLRNLLKEEDETYRKELEERKKLKTRPEESSLESLRQKLREKRAEQGLYLPRTCRRYQSYFVCPTVSNSTCWSNPRDTSFRYSHACRDSTNFIHQNGLNSYRKTSKMSEDSGRDFQEKKPQDDFQESGNNNETPNSRYSARYAHKSLENTNVRNDDYEANRTSSKSSFSFGSPTERFPNGDTLTRGENKENKREDVRLNSPENDVVDSRSDSIEDRPDDSGQSSASDVSKAEKSSAEEEKDKKHDTRQFEVEKSMPWLRMDPGDKNLSKPMFLYLTHKELKCKIEDLAKRETHACNKQCWDEALRLRDMKNKLELIREKKLYHMENLEMDEESRKAGLINIDKREMELTEREKVCMDSTMYSEDAKALWKKWSYEDERYLIKDARLQREKLMNSLEKEWQNLAIRDKERISRSYQSVMNDSALQEEHKLSAAINAARMKSVSSPSK